MTEQCSSCRFFRETKAAPNGECWRFPPVPIVFIQSYDDRDTSQQEIQSCRGDVRPLVFSNGWCGEYEPAQREAR